MSTTKKQPQVSYVTTAAGMTGYCQKCSSTIFITGPDGSLVPTGCNCTPPKDWNLTYTPGLGSSPYTTTYKFPSAITNPDFSAEKALQEALDKASKEDTELDLADLLGTVETLRASYKTLEERLKKIEDRHEKKKARRKLEKHKQKKRGTLLKG